MTRLLDLFCGAGGAARGYADAGITDIVGVDLAPQMRYPYPFVQCDALEYLADCGRDFDIIHASPPCQAYSSLRFLNIARGKGKEWPRLIEPLLPMLAATGRHWVVENVMGARDVLDGSWLCGQMFGRPFFRHRIFASSFLWLAPAHPKHAPHISRGGGWGRPRMSYFAVGGDGEQAAQVMGIDWMTHAELVQAVPPCYTEYIANQFLSAY